MYERCSHDRNCVSKIAMIANKATTKQFTNSYHSTKCNGAGNGRKTSNLTAKLRRQINKKRRQFLKSLD